VTESSFDRECLVHDCLPRHVRRLSPDGVRYRLLSYVVRRLVGTLRSACRQSLQKRMLLVDRLLFGAAGGPLVSEDATELGGIVERLRGI
jgi:hypothetical protein